MVVKIFIVEVQEINLKNLVFDVKITKSQRNASNPRFQEPIVDGQKESLKIKPKQMCAGAVTAHRPTTRRPTTHRPRQLVDRARKQGEGEGIGILS
jgi:hypothetical protein